MPICPRCNAKTAKKVTYAGVNCSICNACGYDERLVLDTPEKRVSQREKGRYNPYRTGGSRRSRN